MAKHLNPFANRFFGVQSMVGAINVEVELHDEDNDDLWKWHAIHLLDEIKFGAIEKMRRHRFLISQNVTITLCRSCANMCE